MEKQRRSGVRVDPPEVEIRGIVRSPSKFRDRLMIAIGMTGLVRAEWALSRWGQVIPCNWQQLDYIMWMDTYAPLGWMVADWRNMAVKELLEKNIQTMVFIDHDVILPPDFYIKMNERLIKERVPIWSGLYFTKSFPAEPILYRGKSTGFFADWKMGDKVWVNAIPMGCTVIHSSIFKALWDESEEYKLGNQIVRRVFDSPRKAWEDPESHAWMTRTGTEDLDFCWKVIEKGIFKKAGWPEYQKKKYPILCDTSIFCRHITDDGTMYPSRGEDQYFRRKGK